MMKRMFKPRPESSPNKVPSAAAPQIEVVNDDDIKSKLDKTQSENGEPTSEVALA